MLKQEYGCEYVLNQKDSDFKQKLSKLAAELQATVMLECIGGTFTSELMACMPLKSTCVFYGSLVEEGLGGFEGGEMMDKEQAIEGFILNGYIKSKGLLGLLPVIARAVSLMHDKTLQSKIQKRLKLTEIKEGLEGYYKNMTGGKFVLCPHDADPSLEKTQPVFSIKDLNSN